jgi:leucyl-tRNA synthetase
VAPFAPFIADELWQQLGHSTSVHKDSWPKWDEKYLISDTVKIAVQINGKVRSQILMPKGSSKEMVEKAALEDEKVKNNLNGKKPARVIYVPGKILNLVVD